MRMRLRTVSAVPASRMAAGMGRKRVGPPLTHALKIVCHVAVHAATRRLVYDNDDRFFVADLCTSGDVPHRPLKLVPRLQAVLRLHLKRQAATRELDTNVVARTTGLGPDRGRPIVERFDPAKWRSSQDVGIDESDDALLVLGTREDCWPTHLPAEDFERLTKRSGCAGHELLGALANGFLPIGGGPCMPPN